MEHVFFQLIHLFQISTLHLMFKIHSSTSISSKPILLSIIFVLQSTIWLFRDYFPTHSFMENYKNQIANNNREKFILFLYRMKKWQFVFYKHFLLHGLTITTFLNLIQNEFEISFLNQTYFQVYWLTLNTSYVMEFFLQTLVKVGRLKQTNMLQLQLILMTSASLSAFQVLRSVNIFIALFSLILNFQRRKRDFSNSMIVASIFFIIYRNTII